MEPVARWIVADRDSACEETLCRELKVSSLVAALLCNRGFRTAEAAHNFLNPSLDNLHSPKLLPDYQEAESEILGAKERGDLIYVHGDYDVDGITSAAIFSRFLSAVGCKVHTHVPHRMKEGFGVHKSAVQAASEMGAKLFLTCDCGSSAIPQMVMAREQGMRVVVTDHHEPEQQLPDVHAVVNPHRSDSKYPFTEISGAGVVFRLCEGLTEALGHSRDRFREKFLDLAVLGTIADVMPLVDENRIIARFGLPKLAASQKPGLIALKEVSNLAGREITAYDVGFKLGPRLNAAGRIDDAAVPLELLLSRDIETARSIAACLEQMNTQRREDQARMEAEAEEIVDREGLLKNLVLIVVGDGWHQGVVGIVAGRLAERFSRPAFVMIRSRDGMVHGSARSNDLFALAPALQALKPPLISGGGHAKAAGCALREKDLPEFRLRMEQLAAQVMTLDDLVPTLAIDMELRTCEVTLDSVSELTEQFEPFGQANRKPLFLARNVELSQVRPTRNPKVFQPSFRTSTGHPISAVAFDFEDRAKHLVPGSRYDIAFQVSIDRFRAMPTVKWEIRDIASAR